MKLVFFLCRFCEDSFVMELTSFHVGKCFFSNSNWNLLRESKTYHLHHLSIRWVGPVQCDWSHWGCVVLDLGRLRCRSHLGHSSRPMTVDLAVNPLMVQISAVIKTGCQTRWAYQTARMVPMVQRHHGFEDSNERQPLHTIATLAEVQHSGNSVNLDAQAPSSSIRSNSTIFRMNVF